MEAGANQRVTTDSGIVLDFAGLFGDSVEQKRPSKTPLETILEGGQYKTITEPKKPAEAPPEGLEGQQAKGLYLQAKREAAEKQRTLDIFREYQENIKRSGQLQTEILKGVKAGENVYNLFLDRQRVCQLERERIKKDPLKSDKLRSGFILSGSGYNRQITAKSGGNL